VSPPPPPPAAALDGPSTLKDIILIGFGPDAEQNLRRRLPVRVGDSVNPGDSARIAEIVRDFDEHATVTLRKNPNSGDSLLTIGLPNVSVRTGAQTATSIDPSARPIGGRIAEANRVNVVQPVYPPLAKQARVQGPVQFQIVIGTDGAVKQIELISGNPLLVQAAKDAVSQWTYKPVMLNGVPTAVQTDVTITFTLAE